MSMTEALRAKASLNNKEWNSSVDSMKKKTTAFKRAAVIGFKKSLSSAKRMASGMASVAKVGAAGLTAAGVAMGAMVKKSADAGDEMDKMSKRTGLAADFLSKMKYASELSGTSIESFEKGIKKLQQSASDAKDGLKTYTREFDKLGISVTDQNGNLKNSEQLFLETTAALSKMENHTAKAAIASKLFGRAGTQLLPVLADGQKGMMSMMEEADKLGYTWTNKTAKSAADLNDSFARVWTVVGGLVNRFSAELFPHIQRVTDGIVSWYTANRELVNGKVVEWAQTVGDAIKGAWAQVKSWAADGTFLLWWERAKLTVQGFEIALAGVKSALDYAVAGYYRLKAAKEYWTGTDVAYDQARRTARTYESRAANRSTGAVRDYQAQAQKVAALEAQVASAQAKPAAAGNTTVNVSVANEGLQRLTPKEAKLIADEVRRVVKRGKARPATG